MGIRFGWQDAARHLRLSLVPGSRMRPPMVRDLEIRIAGEERVRRVSFDGKPLSVRL
jgi:hypothetical protein